MQSPMIVTSLFGGDSIANVTRNPRKRVDIAHVYREIDKLESVRKECRTRQEYEKITLEISNLRRQVSEYLESRGQSNLLDGIND